MVNQIKLTVLFGLVALAAVVSLLVGAASLSAADVLHLLVSFSNDDFIIHQYRFPRTILAIGVGAGLGLSGLLVQGVIRNPLASPDLMGISAGAGLAATASLVWFPNTSLNWLPLIAMFGGVFAANFGQEES